MFDRLIHYFVFAGDPTNLQCTICFETGHNMDTPWALRCHHIFCYPCVVQYAITGRNPMCPLCRRQFRSFSHLSVNFGVSVIYPWISEFQSFIREFRTFSRLSMNFGVLVIYPWISEFQSFIREFRTFSHLIHEFWCFSHLSVNFGLSVIYPWISEFQSFIHEFKTFSRLSMNLGLLVAYPWILVF